MQKTVFLQVFAKLSEIMSIPPSFILLCNREGPILKILILGFGNHASGADAAEYYRSYNHEVHLYESRPRASFGSMPLRLEEEGVFLHFEDIDVKTIPQYDLVVKNPATPVAFPAQKKAKRITNDFAALLTNPDVAGMKKIVIVGNKGKTLLASAVCHALNEMGAHAQMCGVIGMSGYHLLKDIKEKGPGCYTHLVLEMASWQITDTANALHGQWPKLDLVIMTSKANAQRLDKRENYRIFGPWVDKAIIDRDARATFLRETGFNKKKLFLSPSVFNPMKNATPHESAFDVLKALGYHKSEIAEALSTYKGIPHRMEQVALKDNILYINDSASILPESVAYAVKTMGQASIHLIMGGTERGNTELGSLSIPIKMATSITLLSGSFTEKIISILEKKDVPYSGPFENMEDAVASAREKANEFLERNGNTQIIILSPGASGYEYFQNEFNRGNIFKRIVKEMD